MEVPIRLAEIIALFNACRVLNPLKRPLPTPTLSTQLLTAPTSYKNERHKDLDVIPGMILDVIPGPPLGLFCLFLGVNIEFPNRLHQILVRSRGFLRTYTSFLFASTNIFSAFINLDPIFLQNLRCSLYLLNYGNVFSVDKSVVFLKYFFVTKFRIKFQFWLSFFPKRQHLSQKGCFPAEFSIPGSKEFCADQLCFRNNPCYPVPNKSSSELVSSESTLIQKIIFETALFSIIFFTLVKWVFRAEHCCSENFR